MSNRTIGGKAPLITQDGAEAELPHERAEMMERAALGCVVIDGARSESAETVLGELLAEDFYFPRHQIIFKALLELATDGAVIDLVTLGEHLKGKRLLEAAGGELYLSDLLAAPGSVTHVHHYVTKVRQYSITRNIRRRIQALSPDATAEQIEPIIDLMDLRDTRNTALVRMSDILDAHLAELQSGHADYLKTGFPTFDCGIYAQAGDLIVIAARAGVGKTAYMSNILHNLLQHGIHCLYCPTETQPAQFLDRLIPQIANVRASKFRSRDFSAEDKASLANARDKLMRLPLSLLDKASPTLREIRQHLRVSGAKVLFVDYLSRCSMPREENRAREIERFMVDLKTLCQEQKVVCFLAVQLSRRTDHMKEGEAPLLADLADSSAVEKEADAVVFLWRKKKVWGDINLMEIDALFGKNRWGFAHSWMIDFDRKSMCMTEQGAELAKEAQDVPPML